MSEQVLSILAFVGVFLTTWLLVDALRSYFRGGKQ